MEAKLYDFIYHLIVHLERLCIKSLVLSIIFFLPKGGGVWIEGPKSELGLNNLNYKFYSGGRPLLTRRNAVTGRLEIFIRDVHKHKNYSRIILWDRKR